MSLSDFIEELEQLKKDYGDLDLPWTLVRVETEDIKPTARAQDSVAEQITIDMGNAHAARLPREEEDNQ